jgi:hypothetical protein
MNLIKLTPREENSLRIKVGDLEVFKARILNTRIRLSDFGIYRDADDPGGTVYIALKDNPRFTLKKTGVSVGRY